MRYSTRRACFLSTDQILHWAANHRARCGTWPSHNSGRVLDAPWESWSAINVALTDGRRGLAGGDSLARLLRRVGCIGERRGRPVQIERHQQIARLHATGLTPSEIGRQLGVSRQAAWEMLRRTSTVDLKKAV